MTHTAMRATAICAPTIKRFRTGPPKTPRGGSPAFGTRLDAGVELMRSVQNEVPRRGLVEQPETGIGPPMSKREDCAPWLF
jgi:hypothetical protein